MRKLCPKWSRSVTFNKGVNKASSVTVLKKRWTSPAYLLQRTFIPPEWTGELNLCNHHYLPKWHAHLTSVNGKSPAFIFPHLFTLELQRPELLEQVSTLDSWNRGTSAFSWLSSIVYWLVQPAGAAKERGGAWDESWIDASSSRSVVSVWRNGTMCSQFKLAQLKFLSVCSCLCQTDTDWNTMMIQIILKDKDSWINVKIT